MVNRIIPKSFFQVVNKKLIWLEEIQSITQGTMPMSLPSFGFPQLTKSCSPLFPQRWLNYGLLEERNCFLLILAAALVPAGMLVIELAHKDIGCTVLD